MNDAWFCRRAGTYRHAAGTGPSPRRGRFVGAALVAGFATGWFFAAPAVAKKDPGAKTAAAAGGKSEQRHETTATPAIVVNDIGALLAHFAAAPGIAARFREEKHLAMLDTPLVNEGTIHFAPPGRLVRRTERPLASTVLIDEDRVQFGDSDGEHSLDLRTNPVARSFVDSFVMILAGNRNGLEKLFEMRFTPAPTAGGDWRLALAPRVSPMNKVIKSILVQGRGIAIRDVDIRESSGDWTRTSFSDVDVNHRHSPEEQARLFRMPGQATPTPTSAATPPTSVKPAPVTAPAATPAAPRR